MPQPLADDQRLGAGLDPRPPGVDVAPHVLAGLCLGREVVAQGTAATLRRQHADPEPIQQPGRRGVDARREQGLHTPLEQECPPGMAWDRPDGRRRMLGDVPAQGVGHERPDELGGAQERSQAARVRQHSTQEETLQPFAEWSRAQSLNVGPADVEQARILDTRGTGGLACAATQAAIEVDLGGAARLVPLQEGLDEVDAPARAVQLVAQEPVGRAARRAETAMDATAQDGVGLPACGRVLDEGGERRLHQRSPYIRPRLKIRRGSKASLRRACNAPRPSGSGGKTSPRRSPPRNRTA